MIKYKHRTAIRKLDTSRKSDLHATEKKVLKVAHLENFQSPIAPQKLANINRKDISVIRLKPGGFTSIRIALNFQ